ncbi:TlpA disulfide reductase family protein [Tropicimonas sp.]|uniref:TlpA disulfide reductase family protein n=1 Tax=Tropicimonas sp. TaxID=2067044 RepID=UPI003A847A63
MTGIPEMALKRVLAAVVYTGLALLANGALAQPADVAALREGGMKKLALHEAPGALPDIELTDADDTLRRLSEFRGKWLVVNFWATWCAPCRNEMPTLSNLQTIFADRPVEVVTIATGRNAPAAIDRFFDEIGVTNLPKFRDPRQQLARQMGIMGLPVTVIVDPEGREVGRLIGDAPWDSESSVAILEALSAAR